MSENTDAPDNSCSPARDPTEETSIDARLQQIHEKASGVATTLDRLERTLAEAAAESQS